MFLLMPFWTKEGGMSIPYAPGGAGPLREIELDHSKMYPFADVKLAKEILFEGDPDNSELNYGNKPPKFRIWTKGWTKAQWDFFLNLLSEVPDSLDGSIKVSKYPQFGGKIFYTSRSYDIMPGSDEEIGAEWAYPIEVLEWLVENGKIVTPTQIQYIKDRKEKEKKARLAGKLDNEVLEEIKQEDEELKKAKIQILPASVTETLEAYDPTSEFDAVAEDLKVEAPVSAEIAQAIPEAPDLTEPIVDEAPKKKSARGSGGKFVGAK